jgi:hypothetical protein
MTAPVKMRVADPESVDWVNGCPAAARPAITIVDPLWAS